MSGVASARSGNRLSWSAGAPALLALAVVLTYIASLRCPFEFDDVPAIAENPTLRHPGDLAALLAPPGDLAGTVGGRPVLNLTLALNFAAGGVNPLGYHALNIAIHACAALLLFGLVFRTLDGDAAPPAPAGPLRWRSPWRRPEARLIAFVAALAWAVHPLLTEAVTYVVQRAESLMGLLYLLTLYAFARHASGGPCRRAWAAVSVAACLLGMGTKEVMVSAPLVVLTYDRTFVSGTVREAWRRRRGYYLALGSTWALLAVLVWSTHGRGGSAGFGSSAGAWPYALTQGRAIARYVRLSLWPDPLVFDYGTALVSNLGKVAWPALAIAAALGFVLVGLVRRRAAAYAAFCFFAVLAPSSSLIPVATEPVAEHRMYLPLAAVTVLLSALAFRLFSRLWPRGARTAFLAAGLAACSCLALATGRRNRDYRSAVALWADTAAKAPGNPRAHNNLAEAYLAEGRGDRAESEFEAAAAVDPDYAPAQYNLGAILLDSGRPAEAVPHLVRALRAPRHRAQLELCLGEAYERTARPAEAAESFREALNLSPASEEAAFGLGNNLAASGKYADAVEPFRRAVALAPDRATVRNNLANDLLYLGRVDEAIAQYREALRRDPGNASVRENLEMALGAPRR